MPFTSRLYSYQTSGRIMVRTIQQPKSYLLGPNDSLRQPQDSSAFDGFNPFCCATFSSLVCSPGLKCVSRSIQLAGLWEILDLYFCLRETEIQGIHDILNKD